MSGLTGGPEAERILTEAECAALAEQIFRFRRDASTLDVAISSRWSGMLRWGRNRVTLASDRQESRVAVSRQLDYGYVSVETNQLDPAALEAVVREVERLERLQLTRAADRGDEHLFTTEYLKPAVWSEATYQLTAEARGAVARTLIEPAEAKGMLSAGYLAAEAQAQAFLSSEGRRLYARMTQGRCAMTVRDPEGTASGWAGKTSYDWGKIPASALAERALQKCVASRNPVQLEPGRYTVILEPQAVADLLSPLMDTDALWRIPNESPIPPASPFWLRPQFSKLGLKVADERVVIWSDPMDPELGVMPFYGRGDEPADPHRKVTWIDKGVLTNLFYNRPGYAVPTLGENVGRPQSPAWRMAGGETSIEEMIATTKRGLLVTRFWDVDVLSSKSLLSTGLTRDGLWLIENGTITKPVKNFRFVDSPLFVLNNLEQLGPAEPIFRPGTREGLQPLLRPAAVPPLKVRDFNFTALVDAV